MRTSVAALREILGLEPKRKRKYFKPSRWPMPLLMSIPVGLTLWAILSELSLMTPSFMTDGRVLSALKAAEAAVTAMDEPSEDGEPLVEFNASALYPDQVFETDWRKYVEPSKILHLNAIHRGCITHKESVIPWTFGRPGQTEREELEHIVTRDDPNLLDKLRQCPDIDIFLPEGLRNFGYCEDAAAFSFLLYSFEVTDAASMGVGSEAGGPSAWPHSHLPRLVSKHAHAFL